MDNMKNTEKLLKGKYVADKISERLIEDIKILHNNDIIPKLAIVRVGNRADDLAYERGIIKRCEKVDVEVKVIQLQENVTQEKYINTIKGLNEDKLVDGILCFRPLPSHLNEQEIKYIINPKKDIDSFNPINTAKTIEGDETAFVSCTPLAVIEMLRYYEIPLEGSNIVVVGRSMVVGKPVSMLLLNENATVTVCHSKTKNLKEITSQADILVAAVGKAKMITKEYIKEDAVVIDVGINVDEDGNLCGDVDTEDVLDKVAKITPVPLGVGSITNTILVEQLIKACKLQHGL